MDHRGAARLRPGGKAAAKRAAPCVARDLAIQEGSPAKVCGGTHRRLALSAIAYGR
jgi:hypothetical protein